MAAIVSQLETEFGHPETSPGISADLGGFSNVMFTPTVVFVTDNTVSGRYSSFRVTRCTSLAISGSGMAGFFDDFYNRIHVSPSSLPLGNLTAAQARDIEVWNAYTTPQLLSSVVQEGTDGISLVEPLPTPTYFGAVEARTYQLNISTNGAPVIGARLTFNFATMSPSVVVTGQRVTVFPFIPQTQHGETLEWKTDIVASYKSEQRMALRASPRQSFSYTFQLDPQQFSRVKAIATQWAHRVYGIPVWAELTRVGPLSAGATYVLLDTTSSDYRPDDLILIWESDEKYVAVETDLVLADRVTLKLPLVAAYANAYAAPVRFARTLQGMSFTRGNDEVTRAGATFLVNSNKDLGVSVGYAQYRGKDVLTDRTVLVSGLTERISRAIDVFDNGSGPLSVDATNDWASSKKLITFDALTRADKWKARKWIHSRRGRQKAFWLPSWNNDLILTADVATGLNSLSVQYIGYSLYYGAKDIMVQHVDGTRRFMRVLSGAVDVDGNETLALEVALTAPLNVADIAFISFLSHVRLDADRVEVKHGLAGRATASIPVTETPE